MLKKIVNFVSIMDAYNLHSELIKGLISLGTGCIILALGWLVGNNLTYRMNIRQKRREIEIDRANQFFQLYGEFFAIWKLYNHLLIHHFLNDTRYIEILKRASDAEAGIEAILIKIASDKKLSQNDIETLGNFRQSYQFLRETICNKRQIDWYYCNHYQYKRFKELSCKVANMLLEDNKNKLSSKVTNIFPIFCKKPTNEEAFNTFLEITDNKWEKEWDKKWRYKYRK